MFIQSHSTSLNYFQTNCVDVVCEHVCVPPLQFCACYSTEIPVQSSGMFMSTGKEQ